LVPVHKAAPPAASSGSLVPVPKEAPPPPPPSSPVIYSIGDLHGDYERFKLILDGLGLATFQPLYSPRGGPAKGDVATWTGGRNILVSTGDTVDRGDHSRPIFNAFMSLRAQAARAGGEVVNVLGNHDLMNIVGEFDYVSNAELHSQGDYGGPQQRAFEFSEHGTIGSDIRRNYVVAAVRGGTLFVHAGLDPMWLRQSGGSLDAMNRRVRAMINRPVIPKTEPILDNDGPMWDRKFADGHALACTLTEETLRLVGAKRMVVGHTIQPKGVEVKCPSAAGPRIILADTAISRAYGPFGKASAVEYKEDSITAIYFQEHKGLAPQRVPLTAAPPPNRFAPPLFGAPPLEPGPRGAYALTPRVGRQPWSDAQQTLQQALVPPRPPQQPKPSQPEPWRWQMASVVSQAQAKEEQQILTRLAQPGGAQAPQRHALLADSKAEVEPAYTLLGPSPSPRPQQPVQPRTSSRPQTLQPQPQQPQRREPQPPSFATGSRGASAADLFAVPPFSLPVWGL